MRLRNWCFTLFIEENESEEEFKDRCPSLFEHCGSDIRYAVWQLERCPSTSKMHVQGYVEFKSSMRIASVKRLLGSRCHLERRNGPREAAIEYCRKEDTRVDGPWQQGDDKVSPGKRTDIHEVCDLIKNSSGTFADIMDEYAHVYVRYPRGFDRLLQEQQLRAAPLSRDVEVLVYWGTSGAGKTRKAVEENPEYFMLDSDDRLWFDGYRGEPTLILDDFYGWIRHATLLKMLDRYRFRCPVKGGNTWAQWTRVIITSNKHPEHWYKNSHPWSEDAALQRRIKEIVEFQ